MKIVINDEFIKDYQNTISKMKTDCNNTLEFLDTVDCKNLWAEAGHSAGNWMALKLFESKYGWRNLLHTYPYGKSNLSAADYLAKLNFELIGKVYQYCLDYE